MSNQLMIHNREMLIRVAKCCVEPQKSESQSQFKAFLYKIGHWTLFFAIEGFIGCVYKDPKTFLNTLSRNSLL